MPRLSLLLFIATLLLAQTARSADNDAIDCRSCDAWNAPQQPFRLFGDSYYVGTRGLASVLIVSDVGLIVLDGGLPQSATRIADNIRALGYRVQDVRWILNSHAHFDHAGGIAALARMSGAQVAASERGAEALRLGAPTADDPQAGYGDGGHFPALAQVTPIVDGGSLTLGNVRVRAHYTPGHTPGSTTWTWQSCEGEHCVSMVYADSLNAVAAPGFRFSDSAQRVAEFRASIDRVAKLGCDVLISVHPEFSDLFARHNRGAGHEGLLDPEACQRYTRKARAGLKKTLSNETIVPTQASTN